MQMRNVRLESESIQNVCCDVELLK